MNAAAYRLALVFAVLAVSAAAAAPGAGDEIPTYKVLSCEKDCPDYVPAKKLRYPAPEIPPQYSWRLMKVGVDALVDIDYIVAADGTTQKLVVENAIGPREFVDSALAALKDWKFKPALEGGKPVEENRRQRFICQGAGFGPHAARREVVLEYEAAAGLVTAGRTDDAIAALRDIAARPLQNFYERSMVAYNLAILYAGKHDYWRARDEIRTATLGEAGYLDWDTRNAALRLRIKLEAANGDYAESFAWYDILDNYKNFGDGDDVHRLVTQLHATIAASAPIAMTARIPDTGNNTLWHHQLLRRSFEFHNIVGKLDRFELRCEQHSILSPVSEKADWNVPASWSGCFINVFGAPATTFEFFELQPDAAPAKP